jgi:multiple sugar transport system permease protein
MKKNKLSPYLYILPAMIIIIAFRFIPILLSFVISFFDWKLTGVENFVGFENYGKLFTDAEFLQSMTNTIWFVVMVVPVTIVLSLFFAVLLNNIKWLRGFFRTAYFLPYVTSMVAVSIVWKIIFQQRSGLFNYFLEGIGLEPLKWLNEPTGIFTLLFQNFGITIPDWMGGPSLALFSIMIVTVWKSIGYNTIIYLAGLQNIAKEYYEASSIDGASKTKQFFGITIPLVSPTTYYVLMMTTIVTFQSFSQIYLMTGTPAGGPQGTTSLIVYYIFEAGFIDLNFSYANAIALVLFVVILLLTLIQKRLEKHVTYE